MMLSSVSRGPSILCVSLSSSKTSLTSRGVVFGQSSKRHHRQDRAAFSSNRMTTTRCLRICAAAASAQKNNNNNNNNNEKKTKTKKGRKKKDEKNAYAATVALPHTTFEMRANAVKKEPLMQKWWLENNVYKQISSAAAATDRGGGEGECFTLHDGPPYANGDLHIGHALNKILKDFITRYQALRGKRVRYVPGWDTHGLPIELKVLQSIKDPETRKQLTPIKLRKKAAKFAMGQVEQQSKQFQRYGIWGDFDNPYMTLQPEYEASQLEVFGKMFLNGHIYRGKKPVHWSPSSQTALAEAELEYPDVHVSQSVYVAFPINVAEGANVTNETLKTSLKENQLKLAVWTTTPWTMPANAAVAMNPKLEYRVCDFKGEKIIVANDLIESLSETLESKLTPLGDAPFLGAELEGLTYQHPTIQERVNPVIVGGDYITIDAGTGLVHTAPGHGQDDYVAGLKYNLPLHSPVDDLGNFTEEAGNSELVGLNVLGEGNEKCIEQLTAANALLKREAYEHKYPYDWRTKKPTIFRATEQWFCSVEGFRDDALKALDSVKFIPESGSKRMRPMVSGRSDWCISRQRSWGVPIPCFFFEETNEVLMDESIIKHVTDIVRKEGTDAWFMKDIEDLLPSEHKSKASSLRRGTDTMDVWFDSGSSWNGVLNERGMDAPCDLYLEGSDQHRGWFQSSLLTSVAATGRAPYKTLLTHGFVLDENGYKMSKSKGNVIDPKFVIEGGKNQKTEPGYGADTLRLWVASTDYNSDVSIGTNVIKQTSENYRKIRGTLRFLMGVENDFVRKEHAIAFDQLPGFDKYCLYRLEDAMKKIEHAYDNYNFAAVNSEINAFTTFLSNVYLDVSKDRLYLSHPSDPNRRAAQTVVHELITNLLAALAPILPHTAEEAFLARDAVAKEDKQTSVFLQGWPNKENSNSNSIMSQADAKNWEALIDLRSVANLAIEDARNSKLIGASLETSIKVFAEDETFTQFLKTNESFLKEMFICSEVILCATAEDFSSSSSSRDDDDEKKKEQKVSSSSSSSEFSKSGDSECVSGKLFASASRARGEKCLRCWCYSRRLGETDKVKHPKLCERCGPIVLDVAPDLVYATTTTTTTTTETTKQHHEEEKVSA